MLFILESRQTTVCPIWTTAKPWQIVERVGLSDRQRGGPIELWDSGADQFGDMRRLGGAQHLWVRSRLGALMLGSKSSALIDGCWPTSSFGFPRKRSEGKYLRYSS